MLAEVENVEVGVVAGPISERLRRLALAQLANKIAVGVEDTNVRHVDGAEAFLPSSFADQGRGREYRRLRSKLVVEYGCNDHVTVA